MLLPGDWPSLLASVPMPMVCSCLCICESDGQQQRAAGVDRVAEGRVRCVDGEVPEQPLVRLDRVALVVIVGEVEELAALGVKRCRCDF